MGLSYEEGKKTVVKGMWLLGAVTVVEVLIALLGNGHLISGFTLPKIIMYPAMIGLSLYKAYFIIYEFMHLRYEVKGLAMTILLPTLLLVWGVIAFMQEGTSWGDRRTLVLEKNAREVTTITAPESSSNGSEDIKEITE